MNITIIGLGGIGSILCGIMARYLAYSIDSEVNLLLVDGDFYESKNFDRQEFTRMGNKAEVKTEDIAEQFPQLNVSAFPNYINEMTLAEVINEGDIIFLCVDNHKTRMLVSNYSKTLKDVILFSGGNDLTDGNVQIYLKENGVELTPDLCSYHPEIANPEDKLPEEMSCEELANSEPQIIFANLGATTLLCWAFYNVVVRGAHEKSEAYFDIIKMTSHAKIRIVK